ncbi:MAG: sirohydrochlorin cobaltochelatase, partial [Erysipelotrichaceae bacterium]|nr:sirohydrochlorin cobaltochelatase [Erysipelotrichaceae bacterium]
MSKTFRKFLVMLLVLTVTLAFSGMSAFAYTALDDDGARDKADEESMHVVYSTAGMLRFQDEGTTATLSEDGKTVDVVATSKASKSWGKLTKLAFIEQEATAEEKDEAAKAIKFDDDTLTEEAVSRTVHFSIPVEEVGKMIPICRYVDGEWKDFSEQAYIIVLEEGITPVELAIDNSIKMFKPETATLGVKDGKPAVNLVLGSDSYTAVYPGYASEATDEKTIPIEIKDGKGYVTIPVEEFEKETVLAFKGSKFFNRTMSVSAKDKKVTFVPTEIKLDQFENMTTEEAIAHAKDYATVDLVNALIESIQVQSRNENTDKYCAIAKAYWDALSDKDKEKDDGYFSEDTGDASKDDPLNQDNIGENELLVVSFGTSFNGSRAEDIGGVEKALQKAFPDWSVRRAFTAQIIINHVQARDGEFIDNMDQALQRAVDNGVKNLVVQPTHLMHGAEYDELVAAVKNYESKFESVLIAEPLLGEVGAAGTDVNADKETAAKSMVAEAVKVAGFDSLDAMAADGTA